jgi:transposase
MPETLLRDGIRDDQWDRIKDLLPGRIGHVGATARNNRLFIDAVLYRVRTGIAWRDLPEPFGDFKNIHRRFSRWAEKGLWTNLFSLRTEDADEEYVMIDSTLVRAHQPGLFSSVSMIGGIAQSESRRGMRQGKKCLSLREDM